MGETNSELAKRFHADFTSRYSDVQSRFKPDADIQDPSTNPVDEVAGETARLRKALVDAIVGGYLPSYDQRKYDNDLKDLERRCESLRASSAPKNRFAFKRKTVPPSNASSSTASTGASTQTINAEPRLSSAGDDTSSSSSGLSITSRTSSLITWEDILNIGTQPRSELTIRDLDKCLLDLWSRPDTEEDEPAVRLSAVHVRNVKNSVLLLPDLQSSVLLHDVENCLIMVKCQQFRMHSSAAVDVVLGIPSSPIIEHCSKIRFGAEGASELVGDTNVLPYVPQDFSHIRATPSPNWAVLNNFSRNKLQEALKEIRMSGPSLHSSELAGNGNTGVGDALLSSGLLPEPATTR